MYCIKGSKHTYLMDYNSECNRPVWSNMKNWAFITDLKTIIQIQQFLKKTQGIEYEIATI